MNRILVGNDDGIESFGLRTLVRFLSHMAEVYVVAPDSQCSGHGQAITLSGLVTAREIELEGAERAIALTGTPADCAKFGIDMLRAEGIEPDYVIGGINHGGNAGTDINYSGTFAIANEGALNGYKALALSVTSHSATHFEYICEMLPELLEVAKQLPQGIILNVNSPDLPKWQIKGTRYTEAGGIGFDNTFVKAVHETDGMNEANGSNSPATNAGVIELSSNAVDPSHINGEYRYMADVTDGSAAPAYTDLYALADGYATVTPYRVNRVDSGMLAKLRGLSSDRTLCIIMDVQKHMIPEMRKSERFMNNVLKLARCLNILELPTLLTEQYGYDSEPVAGELKNELRSYEKIDKVDFDCTTSPDLEALLQSHKGNRIVLAGLEAHISIMQTAKSLMAKGYDVQVIKDCCASKQKEPMEAAMQTLADEGCTITTLEAFAYEEVGSTVDFAYRHIRAALEI